MSSCCCQPGLSINCFFKDRSGLNHRGWLSGGRGDAPGGGGRNERLPCSPLRLPVALTRSTFYPVARRLSPDPPHPPSVLPGSCSEPRGASSRCARRLCGQTCRGSGRRRCLRPRPGHPAGGPWRRGPPAGSRAGAAARTVCGLPGSAWASGVQVGPSGQTLPSHHSPWHFFPDASPSRPAVLMFSEEPLAWGRGWDLASESDFLFIVVTVLNPDTSHQSLR